jgi:hypothetical protein
MQSFRARVQTAYMTQDKSIPAPPSTAPRYSDRHKVIERCRSLVSDTNAIVEELKRSLLDMISVTGGAEARIVLLGSEKQQFQEANQEKQAKRGRGGRAGHARMYSQAEIEEIRQKERARAEAILSRGRGRGRGRGGRNTRRKSSHGKYECTFLFLMWLCGVLICIYISPESSDEGEVD